MSRIPLAGFCGPSYSLRSVNIDCQRTINLYPESVENAHGKTSRSLIGTPGLRSFATVSGTGGMRALYTSSTGRLFGIRGSALVEISSAGTVTSRGTLSTAAGQVGITDNGIVLFMVDGTYAYTLNLSTNVFARSTDPVLAAASTHCDFQDSYFLVYEIGSARWRVSPANWDGVVAWDALAFATAEGKPDRLVALISNNREVFLLGEQSTEIWANAGAPTMPFSRVSGGVIEIGCAARYSVAKMDGAVFWLGSNAAGEGQVWMAQGYQPSRISDHGIEYLVGQMPLISDAVGYCYQQEGHRFYVLTFPTGNRTLVYDVTEGAWHEREYLDPSDGSRGRHRSVCYAYYNRKSYVGDFANGNVYEMDLGVYTDNGAAIRRERTSPHLHAGTGRLFFRQFRLDMETGIGLDGGVQGSDPQVMLQYSDDGGHTWSNELWRSAGVLGNYRTLVEWNRLGMARSRTFRVVVSDPVKMAIMGAYIDVEQGAN